MKISLMMRGRNWSDLFQKGGTNCRDTSLFITVFIIFINILKNFWAIDNSGTLDNSVEKSRVRYSVLDLARQELKDESVKFI